MDKAEFWELFAETGEPLYWLLSRAQERAPDPEKPEKPGRSAPPEQNPQPKL